jgi:plasmid maintenance system antidote protein VapI
MGAHSRSRLLDVLANRSHTADARNGVRNFGGIHVDSRGHGITAERKPEFWALVRPMRQRMAERGISQEQVAMKIRRHRSRISRALSGTELPPRDLITDIARVLGVDEYAVDADWKRADALRKQAQLCRAGGGPPDDLCDYQDLRRALRNLLAERRVSQRELIRRDPTGTLRRSTVGAVLRGDRSADSDMAVAIVRACGVAEEAMASWRRAWERFGEPYRLACYESQLEGLKRKRFADAMSRWRRERSHRR